MKKNFLQIVKGWKLLYSETALMHDAVLWSFQELSEMREMRETMQRALEGG